MNQTETIDYKHGTTYAITVTALMTAVTCILAPLSIPIGPVPISLTNLAIYISLYLLGWKRGTISYLIYLLIGLVGIPVFSGFTGRFYCHGNYCRTCNRSFPPALAPAHWYDCRNYHMLCARYSMVLL